MTSTYKVEHDNGPSTIEGVHGISHRDHLLFYTEEGKVFAGFAAGTWHSFKKVEVEVAGEAKGTNYTLPAQDATDVLTRDQVFALPVGTRVKSTDDLSEFKVVKGGVAWVTYSGGDPRPVKYQHPDDLECLTDITEFKVIA